MKTYYFNNDSWYDAPACDCCHYEDLVEVFNIDLDRHPEFQQNGSAHSIEDCYESVLINEGVITDGWRGDEVDWKEELLFLEDLMKKNGLQVKIENPGEYEAHP